MLNVHWENGVLKMSNEEDQVFFSSEEIYKDKTVLAFVVEDEVAEIFIADEKLGSILTSNPKIVDITGRDFSIDGPNPGWFYDGEMFFPPQRHE